MRYSLFLIAIATPVSAWPWPGPMRDRHGDPLPPGAVQRLGTIQHRGPPGAAKFSPDGKSIVTLAWGKYLAVYDAATGRRTESRTLPGEPASYAQMSDDARRALLQCTARTVNGCETSWEVWDLVRGERLAEIHRDPMSSQFLMISPDGRRVASFDSHWTATKTIYRLQVWDAATGKETHSEEIEPPRGGQGGVGFGPVLFSPDSRKILVHLRSNQSVLLRCWDAEGVKRRWDRTFDTPLVGDSPLPSPDGGVIVRMSTGLQVLDLETGSPRSVPTPPRPWSTHSATFTRDGSRLLIERSDPAGAPTIDVWNWKDGKPEKPLPGLDLLRGGYVSYQSAPDGRRLLVRDHGLRVYDLDARRVVWGESEADGHLGPVSQLVFSADGRRLATAGRDWTVRLWDVPTGVPIGRWPAPRIVSWEWTSVGNGFRPILEPGIDLSADGRRLAFPGRVASKAPPVLRVIDTATGRETHTLTFPNKEPAASWPNGLNLVGFTGTPDRVVVTFGEQDPNPPEVPRHQAAVCRLDDGRIEVVGPVPAAHFPATAASGNRRRIALRGKVHHLPSGREVSNLAGAGPGPHAVSADGKLVAGVGGTGGNPRTGHQPRVADLRVWDAGSGAVARTLPWAPAQSGSDPWPFARPTPDLRWTYPWRLALHPGGRILATADLFGVRLWDLATARVLHTVPLSMRPPLDYCCGSPATALAFTPDGTRLATGLSDGTVLFWPIPRPDPFPPRPADLGGLWADLVGPDPAKGWRAAWRLLDDPEVAVRLARAGPKPAEPVPAEDVRRWLADVDAADFRRREAATKKLDAAADRIVPAMTEALKAPGTSAEGRERLKKVLAAAPADDRPLPAWAGGMSRAVAVLEHAGTPGARSALKELAAGAPGAWLTREAEAALSRLAARDR